MSDDFAEMDESTMISRRQETPSQLSMTNSGRDWSAVAAAVRQRMAALRFTTVGLARDTGLSEATLRSIRSGTASPRPDTLVRLSKGLAWPGGYLEDVAAGNAYLPPHDPMSGDVIAGIDARLTRVERELDKLMCPAD